MLIQILTQAGIVALVSLIVGVLPMGAGLAYVVRPTEGRLALMRPLSLAGIFAGLGGFLSGLISIFHMIATSPTPVAFNLVSVGVAESLVPLFVAFGSLTVAWLCAAIGMQRHA